MLRVSVPKKVSDVRRECLGFVRKQSRERVFLYTVMTNDEEFQGTVFRTWSHKKEVKCVHCRLKKESWSALNNKS